MNKILLKCNQMKNIHKKIVLFLFLFISSSALAARSKNNDVWFILLQAESHSLQNLLSRNSKQHTRILLPAIEIYPNKILPDNSTSALKQILIDAFTIQEYFSLENEITLTKTTVGSHSTLIVNDTLKTCVENATNSLKVLIRQDENIKNCDIKLGTLRMNTTCCNDSIRDNTVFEDSFIKKIIITKNKELIADIERQDSFGSVSSRWTNSKKRRNSLLYEDNNESSNSGNLNTSQHKKHKK